MGEVARERYARVGEGDGVELFPAGMTETRGPPVVPVETGTHPRTPLDSRRRGNDGCAGVFLRGNDGNAKYWFGRNDGRDARPPVVPVETGTHPRRPWIPAVAGMTVVQGSSCAGMTEMRSSGLAGMTVGTRGRPSFPWRREPIPAAPGSRCAGMTVVQGSSCAGMTEMRSSGLMGMTVGTRGRPSFPWRREPIPAAPGFPPSRE